MRRRILFACWAVLALGLLRPGGASAQLGLAEQAAFDIRALQTKLMVAALSCGRHADYDRVVMRFRGDFLAAFQAIEGYFQRRYGRTAQTHLDSYITALANTHSQAAIAQGGAYCRNAERLWQEALSQPNAVALGGLAARFGVATLVAEVTGQPAPGSALAAAPRR